MKACGMQYDKMRAMINEVGEGGLTEKQKKLPPALQKAILKKMKEDGKLTEEESEAVTQDLLSKKNQKENEVGPEGEMKVVEKPKKDA
jgi:polyhydroxyalkanoate synthesis regulator phasin